MATLRIGHNQCVCYPGEFGRNLQTVLDGLAQAEERGIELMSFPESLLGGYWADEAKCRENAWPLESTRTHEVLEATASSPAMFMVGFNELRGDDHCKEPQASRVGGFDTASCILDGKWQNDGQ